jgi:hypothetical protein
VRLAYSLLLCDAAVIPHSFELFYAATVTRTLAIALRMAAVVAGLAFMVIGVVLLYRGKRDDRRASTVRRFVVSVAITITGAVLAAVGGTLTFVPSPSVSAVDQVGAALDGTSGAATAPPVAQSDSAGNDTSTSPTQPSDAGPPAVRRKGLVALTDGYAFDLDSHDGDWNIEQAKYVHFGENLDLRLFTLLDVHVGIVKVTPLAGYFDCANSTSRQNEIAHDQFSEGDAFCVETDEGRWARVVITSKETDGTYSTRVEMDVVVWEKHRA